MILFNTIAIETNARCTRTCWFCPVKYNKRPNEFMDIKLIENLAQQLKDIDYKGRVEFFMYNEPMLDDRLLDIILMYRSLLPRACLMVSTNADLVKDYTQFQALYDAGVNQLQVNIYSNVPRWREVGRMLEKTTAISVNNVYSYITAKRQEYSLEQKYDKKISPNSPKIGRFELSNRSGLIPSLPALKEPLKKMCVRPFRQMQVNWKGEVVLCCNDHLAQVVCGDVNITPLTHIWEYSKILRKYRQKLLRNKRKGLKLCAPCSFNGGAYPHMVARFWPELGKK